MKKTTKALITATFLTNIPIMVMLVNYQPISLTTNHQVETNLEQPGLQMIDPTYELELTPFNNPEGIDSSGLILLDLKIEQTAIKQVTEVSVKIHQEASTKIYDGGFDDIELNLTYGFTELTNGIHEIEVIIKLDNSDSSEIVLNENIEIITNEQSILGIDKTSMVIKPTINQDETTTYLPDSIQVRLMASPRMFDFSKVDASNAKFRIFYEHNAFMTIGLDYDQDLATATSNEETLIPTSIDDPNYLITLTGIIYDLVPVGPIQITTASEIADGTNDDFAPTPAREPISGGVITKLVISSIVVLTLLGMGLSWVIRD